MGERRVAYRALVGKPEGGDHLKDPGVNGRVILKWIFERLNGDIDWIYLAQDRDIWRDFMNTLMNLQVP
jgi:hypothetical protein